MNFRYVLLIHRAKIVIVHQFGFNAQKTVSDNVPTSSHAMHSNT